MDGSIFASYEMHAKNYFASSRISCVRDTGCRGNKITAYRKKGVMNSLISNRPLSDYHKLTSFILGSKAEGIKQKK